MQRKAYFLNRQNKIEKLFVKKYQQGENISHTPMQGCCFYGYLCFIE